MIWGINLLTELLSPLGPQVSPITVPRTLSVWDFSIFCSSLAPARCTQTFQYLFITEYALQGPLKGSTS